MDVLYIHYKPYTVVSERYHADIIHQRLLDQLPKYKDIINHIIYQYFKQI